MGAKVKAKVRSAAKKIFVIEDDPNILSYIETLLKDWRYNVISCQTGGQAVEMASAEKCDLILLDVMLPDIDGITLCRQLRSDPHVRDTPIIMLTVLSDSNTINQTYSYGATDFITKPFTQAVLKNKIKKAFENAAASKTGAR